MQIFLNECSLHGQYPDANEFSKNMIIVIGILRYFESIKSKEIFKSNWLFYMDPIKNVRLSTVLKENNDLTLRFKTALTTLNIKSWENERVHEQNIEYSFNGRDYNGYSPAEVAERKFVKNDTKSILINYNNSVFGSESQIKIIKDKAALVIIDCACRLEQLKSWLKIYGYVEPYDESSRIAPLDEQTVLGDKSMFELTRYPENNGRKVYRRIGTNQLWTVDGSRKHATSKAHIEVFDENTCKHLGTSIYNKVAIDENFKEPGRTINLN